MTMRSIARQHTHSPAVLNGVVLQRRCACGRPVVAGGECAECRKKQLEPQRPSVLRRRAVTEHAPEVAPPIVHEVLRSPGQPLDAETRAFMEPRFGRDFSRVPLHPLAPQSYPTDLTVNAPGDRYEQEAEQTAEQVMRTPTVPTFASQGRFDFNQVRVHTDSRAARSAQTLNARAFTLGHDIVFGLGEYQPGTARGRNLLGHELTHVAQQKGVTRHTIQRQPQSGSASTPTQAGSAASQNLPATIKFWINVFIPDTVSGARTVPGGPLAGQTMFEGPFPWSDCFMTDSRGFDSRPTASSRTHVEAEVDVGTGAVSNLRLWSSGTKEIDCEDGDIECSETATVAGGLAPAYTRVTNPFVHRLAVTSAAADPCVSLAPDVDVSGVVTINKLSRQVAFQGHIDEFPAFEMYVVIDGGSPKTIFRHFDPSASAWDLVGPPSLPISGRASF